MNKVFGRMKDAFRRESRYTSKKTASPQFESSPIPKPVIPEEEDYEDDDDDDDDRDDDDQYADDSQSMGNYNIRRNSKMEFSKTEKSRLDVPGTSGNPYMTTKTFETNSSLNTGNAMNRSSTGFLPRSPTNISTVSNKPIPIPSNTNPPSKPQIPSETQPSIPLPPPPVNPIPTTVGSQLNVSPTLTKPSSNIGSSSPNTNFNGSQVPSTTQPSLRGFPPGMNLNATNFPTQSSNVGFPPGMNLTSIPTPITSNNPKKQTMDSSSSTLQTASQQVYKDPSNTSNNRSVSLDNYPKAEDTSSRLELDYPIENVLIDANIPSAVAVKINDLVERDRLGNVYRVHRYTYEPKSQQISFTTSDKVIRRVSDSVPIGRRHIREISSDDRIRSSDVDDESSRQHYHYRPHHNTDSFNYDDYLNRLLHAPNRIVIPADNVNRLEQILTQPLTTTSYSPDLFPSYSTTLNQNSVKEPVSYYTARALPNDPMRWI